MLNFVYWPISAILWFWHKVFSLVLSPESGFTWVLAIMFLTFTVRLVLVKPMLDTMRSQRKMQEMAPRMKEIRDKYKNDQQKLMQETRKLQKEMGVNPLRGCLPMLVQMPVFIGLFHVLRSFNRTGTSQGGLGLTIEQNREIPNYVFGVHDVQSFLDARLFGVPLSSYISMPSEMYQAFQPVNFTQIHIAIVAAPMILIIAVATHMNARLGVERQNERRRTGKQAAPTGDQMQMQMQMMNKMMMWVMPATILFTGFLWTIGLLVYMMANNIWTFFQQRYIFGKIDAEEEAEIEAKKAAKRSTAPKPGIKPQNPKKRKK